MTMMTDVQTFSGEEAFAASPPRVFAALTDLDPQGPLARSIPDLVRAERTDEGTLRCAVKPGFSFVRATLKLTVALSDIDPAERAASMLITSKGIGASMRVECRMKVTEAAADGCRVRWVAHVQERTGLLAAVSPALIRGAADNVIRDGWAAMRRNVDGEGTN